MANSRFVRRFVWIGLPIVAVIAVVAFWNWNWFIPIVESQASSVIGRSVAISRLHVQLGRTISVTADGVSVANPPGWPSGDPPFIAISSFTVVVDAWRYLRGDGLILPMIGLDNPRVLIAETKEGTQNYRLETGQGTSDGSVKIGDLRIADGTVRVLVPKLNADFYARIATEGDSEAAKVTVDASGTYAAQPISARLVGGALLSLRDADHPWPVDLALANGPTRLALKGTVRDPVAFKGADVRLRLSGPDLGLLESLVGFPIPKTPAYQLAGKLDLDGLDKIRFDNFEGRIGSSDIAGSIEMQPSGTESKAKSRPAVTMDLKSNRVDLADLSGFIGGTPGRSTTENATAEQRAAAAKATASSKLLADTPISVPRLEWADIHLRYNGAHIEGRNMPLDNLTVVLDAVGGRLMLHPVSFGVGKGRLLANIDLVPVSSKNVHAKVDLRMQNLDVSRMMAAHTFEGAGSVSGVGATLWPRNSPWWPSAAAASASWWHSGGQTRRRCSVPSIISTPISRQTQLGTISSLALGWIGEPALAHLVEPLLTALPGDFITAASHGIAVAIAFIIITALHIVLGELAPKSLALQRSAGTALWVVRPLALFLFIFRPAIMFLNSLGNRVLRLVGLEPGGGEGSLHSPEELKLLARASKAVCCSRFKKRRWSGF